MILACALRGWKVEHEVRTNRFRITNMKTGERAGDFEGREEAQDWLRRNLDERMAAALSDMIENI